MSYPRFTKAGVPTVMFSRGDAFPRPTPADERQLTGESDAGTLRIATLRAPISYLVCNFSGKTALPEGDYLALEAFLTHPLVQLRANPFTFTDVDGAVYTVRYWQGLYNFQRITPALRQGSLTFRIEP